MGGIHNRKFACNHCGDSYIPRRSDQKFCSTSHRAANHQWNRRQQSLKKVAEKSLGGLKEQEIAKPTSGHLTSPLVAVGTAVVSNVIDHIGQKSLGVHNHDLKKDIQAIYINQQILNRKLDNLTFISEQQWELQRKRESDENSWMLNI